MVATERESELSKAFRLTMVATERESELSKAFRKHVILAVVRRGWRAGARSC